MTTSTLQEALELDEIATRVEHALETSCADEVEIVWIESSRRAAGSARQRRARPDGRSITVRVVDRGRLGIHRTFGGDVSDLESAIRHAVAQSRARRPLPGLPHLPNAAAGQPEEPQASDPALWNADISRLGRGRAQTLIERLVTKDEAATLRWGTARVVVANSRGVNRRAQVTHAALCVECGRGAGKGRAVAAARTLSALGPDAVAERARRYRATEVVDELPAADTPIVLAAECVADLCTILKQHAFSACSYQNGTSFLRQHLGDQVFDRRLHLLDDGTDPAALPFPFDLEGTAKQPVDLIAGGTPRTPALDQRQAAVLGLPPTGHSITGNDAQAENLFLIPGGPQDARPLEAADGGLWLGSFRDLECYDPQRLMIRARAGGVRRIEGGRLGVGLPDVIWEDSLLRVLSSLLAIGSKPVVCPTATLLGGISAPALAVAAGGSLRNGCGNR